jgi:methylated-DNA-[protein]-cysteine S-methyltransferase
VQNRTLIFKGIIGDIHCILNGDFLINVSIRNGHDKTDNINDEISFMKPVSGSSNKVFSSISGELELYFCGRLREFTHPFKLIGGTPFERTVWLALREIQFGETKTYKWLAEKIEKPLSYRAVGQALKKNPLPLILPCHRVIASDGSIGGFACGLDIKRRLLRHESFYSLNYNAQRS